MSLKAVHSSLSFIQLGTIVFQRQGRKSAFFAFPLVHLANYQHRKKKAFYIYTQNKHEHVFCAKHRNEFNTCSTDHRLERACFLSTGIEKFVNLWFRV